MSVTWSTTEPTNVVEWSEDVSGSEQLFLKNGKYGCYINVIGAICRLTDNRICVKVALNFQKYYTWAIGNTCNLAPYAAGEKGTETTVYYSQSGIVATYYAILPADYSETSVKVGNYLVNAADGVYVTLTVPKAVGAQCYVNVNGSWKEATVFVNVGGTWKEAQAKINVGGDWK
jgi:hypothetical protein